MSEEIQKETGEETQQEAAEKQKKIDPMEMIRKWGSGTMQLYTPIQDGQRRFTELKWDFLAMTGREYAEAMDTGPNAVAAFSLTSTQALCLFAEAAAKATGGLDARDIRDRMGIMDSTKAIQLATLFFRFSSLAGDRRISAS